MAITAKLVMELREKTGCGMMECKKALAEVDGNFDEAVKLLRERGLAVAQKKSTRVAADGVVDILKSADGKTTAIIEVNSETDFVAKNESFCEFVAGILRTIIANKPADIDALKALPYDGKDVTVEAELKDKIFTIGENITLRRFEIIEGTTCTYIHGKGAAGVVAKFEVSDDIAATAKFAEYAKDVCMQIAAMNPTYLCKHCVPESVIESEKGILMTQIQNDPAMASKPAAVIEKMVTGRINKFYTANCLLHQAFVKEEAIDIEKYTANVAKELGGDIKIVSFVKYEKGEGIEKKEEDFAAEIDKLVKGE